MEEVGAGEPSDLRDMRTYAKVTVENVLCKTKQHRAAKYANKIEKTNRVDEEVGVRLLLYNLVCPDSQTTHLNVRSH